MDKKQLLVLFRSVAVNGMSALEIVQVFTFNSTLDSEELEMFFNEHFPDKNNNFLESFDEFKTFVEFLCVKLRKNSYKFLSVKQYNQDQMEIENQEQFARYLSNIKSFALDTKAQDKKGLLGRFLSF